jgi:pimeloyl-ACP methyl ester carboxylesterase
MPRPFKTQREKDWLAYFSSGSELLGPLEPRTSPLIICFHGSGDSCASWQKLASTLSKSNRVLLVNRGPENPKPNVAVAGMVKYLGFQNLKPPYILIAHSYGGAFAREFLQRYPKDVAGMVLVETGQETALDSKVEENQYHDQILGKRPLVVIRGNSMIGKYKQMEASSHAEEENHQRRFKSEYELLQAWDREDEKLKKRQLGLSANSRYVHIPDCGHHVIRDRPDVVADEVEWILENLYDGQAERTLVDKFVDTLGRLKRIIK